MEPTPNDTYVPTPSENHDADNHDDIDDIDVSECLSPSNSWSQPGGDAHTAAVSPPPWWSGIHQRYQQLFVDTPELLTDFGKQIVSQFDVNTMSSSAIKEVCDQEEKLRHNTQNETWV